jgi:3-hydroxymyristoyl/3-hydroxydecanoyl-(acyl carrier protein) dehydratase
MEFTSRVVIAADHPALPGHFPGHPVVPGVVLLDLAVQAITQALELPQTPRRLTQAKFLVPVGPGAELLIAHGAATAGTIRFEIRCGDLRVASGAFALDAA